MGCFERIMARRRESKEMAVIRAVAALIMCVFGLMILSPNFAAMVERILAIGLVVVVVVLFGGIVWRYRKGGSARAEVDSFRRSGPTPKPYAERSIWNDAGTSRASESEATKGSPASSTNLYARPIERPNSDIAKAHEMRR